MTAILGDHGRLNERSLALHRLVARKLLADPAVIRQAQSLASAAGPFTPSI